MKKFVVLLIAALLVLTPLSACGSGTDPSDAPAGDSAPADTGGEDTGGEAGEASGDEVTVTFSVWSGAAAMYTILQDDFNSLGNGIRLEITEQGDYAPWLTAQASANNLPDIFYLTNYSLTWDFAKAGYTMDLTDKSYAANVYDSTLYGASYNDRLYAMPWALSSANCVIYNIALFEEAGIEKVPETLTELEEACEKLQAAGITPFAAAFLDAWTVGQAYMPCISAQFEDPYAFADGLSDGSIEITEACDTDSIIRLLDLMSKYSQSNKFDTDDAGAVKLLGEGSAAMYINGDWTFINAYKVGGVEDFGLFACPSDDNPDHTNLSMDTGFILGVNAATENPDAVDTVMEYLTSERAQEIFVPYLGIPAFESDITPDYGTASKQMLEYIQADKTTPWFFSLAPNGFKAISESEAVGYLNGTYTADEFWEIWQEEWRNLAQ